MSLPIPKVSIIVPCYNGADYVESCLSSCFNQNYENKEIIFVDNESTDNSLSIAKRLKDTVYPNLIIETEKNIYPFSWQEPVEKAWKIMSGDFFTIIAVDDLILADYISNCVSHMEKTNSMVMQSALYLFNKIEDGKIHVTQTLGGLKYKSLDHFKSTLCMYCGVASPSVFYRSSILKNYTIEFKSDLYLGSCDYYLYCSLADQGLIINSADTPLGYLYRIHDKQSTNGMISLGIKYADIDNSIKNLFRSKWGIK